MQALGPDGTMLLIDDDPVGAGGGHGLHGDGRGDGGDMAAEGFAIADPLLHAWDGHAHVLHVPGVL
jgi:hypothetical protein